MQALIAEGSAAREPALTATFLPLITSEKMSVSSSVRSVTTNPQGVSLARLHGLLAHRLDQLWLVGEGADDCTGRGASVLGSEIVHDDLDQFEPLAAWQRAHMRQDLRRGERHDR